jgi:hypothetical protein
MVNSALPMRLSVYDQLRDVDCWVDRLEKELHTSSRPVFHYPAGEVPDLQYLS